MNDTKKNMWFTIIHEIAILFYLINDHSLKCTIYVMHFAIVKKFIYK